MNGIHLRYETNIWISNSSRIGPIKLLHRDSKVDVDSAEDNSNEAQQVGYFYIYNLAQVPSPKKEKGKSVHKGPQADKNSCDKSPSQPTAQSSLFVSASW